MEKRIYTKQQLLLRSILSASIAIATVAIYVAFGFFFDVFAEITPILLLPFITIPLVWAKKKTVKKTVTAIVSVVLTAIAIGASVGVGIIATSEPAYGIKPMSGDVETYEYSRTFMMDRYNINQKVCIYVWIPDNYTKEKSYPVMYVLDGDNKFNYAAVKAAEFSKNGEGDVIIVGIGYGYWNSAFARGGVIWQDEKHIKGRWRDFCFADDTEIGYLGDPMGGKYKRGKEYSDFVTNTLVKDIRTRYNTDDRNSTLFGHSLGGGLAAYFLTQYDPALGEQNPFTNFIIVDNAFLGYYNTRFHDLEEAMAANKNAAHTTLNIYRIWGGEVNPSENIIQYNLYDAINKENWENVNNFLYIPEGADHSESATVATDNALQMILGYQFGYQTSI